MIEPGVARRRAIVYVLVAAALALLYVIVRGSTWSGSVTLHTVMETAAPLLALVIGLMALVRFYSKKNNTFLLIGVGFLGTAFLDGYHAVVTSSEISTSMPSELLALIPWSWVASRQFLAVLLFLSYLAWRRELRLGEAGQIGERTVYLLAGLFTLLSFAFFAFAPLPIAYSPDVIFHRPEEFLPAAFFLAALVGYLYKNDWRHDLFEHWLVLSLIIGFIGQAIFMSTSGQLFDMEFDVAHLLKMLSYICVLIGLLGSTYVTFRREAERGEAMAAARDRAAAALTELTTHKLALDEHAIVGVTDTSGTITYVNDKFCHISGYDRAELIGQNHRIVNSGYHPTSFFKNMYTMVGNGKSWHGKIRNRTKDGAYYWVETTITPFRNSSGKIVQYVAIRTDITAQKNAEEENAAQRDELAKVNRQKDKFFLIIAHDLRSPFNTLLGYSEFLATQAKSLDRDKIAVYGALVHRAADQAYNLLEDLFDWARLQLDRMEFDPELVDVKNVIDATLIRFEPAAAAKDIDISGDAPLDVEISTDTRMIDTILRNLVNNAIKFTAPGGAIQVTADRTNGSVSFKVSDNGVGMSADRIDSLFQLDRVSSTRGTKGETGTGLGLHLSKELVEKLGGEIRVESVEGEGSSVLFTLPAP